MEFEITNRIDVFLRHYSMEMITGKSLITEDFFADIDKATKITGILWQVLRKQRGEPLEDSYVNRYRVFGLFCKYTEFSTVLQNRVRKAKPPYTISVVEGLSGESYKIKTLDKYGRGITLEKYTHLSDNAYQEKVVELLELGLIEKVPSGNAAIKTNTLKSVCDVINKGIVE